MTKIMFENFKVANFYIVLNNMLSLYATGKINGVVIKIGAGTTWATPIVNGNLLPHSFNVI